MVLMAYKACHGTHEQDRVEFRCEKQALVIRASVCVVSLCFVLCEGVLSLNTSKANVQFYELASL